MPRPPRPYRLIDYLTLQPVLHGLQRIRVRFQQKTKPKKNPYTVVNTVVKDFALITLPQKMLELAEEIADEIVRVIEDQVLTWAPLSPKYLRYKIRSGLDERILIATGGYKDSIEAWIDPEHHWKVWVGVRGEHPEYEGIDLNKLAQWLEYGTRRMPARPHWRPVLHKFRVGMNQTRRVLQRHLEDVLKSRLREEFR